MWKQQAVVFLVTKEYEQECKQLVND